ncbi:MAG: hypothetical protein DI589_05900 [Shinella sp.]|nr:MAG: hypothetical protein DI589_05900 [Shinella sp.]
MSLRREYENQTTEEIIRRGKELQFYSSTSLTTPPPSYDPVFTPLFASMGLGAFSIAGVTGAQIASAIVMTSITTGYQIAEVRS